MGIIKRIFGFFTGANKAAKTVAQPKTEPKIELKTEANPAIRASAATLARPTTSSPVEIIQWFDRKSIENLLRRADQPIILYSNNLSGLAGSKEVPGQAAMVTPFLTTYPNSFIGVPTLVAPGQYFKDATESVNGSAVNVPDPVALKGFKEAIAKAKQMNRPIIMSVGGIGTGNAHLPGRAPETFKALNQLLESELGVKMIASGASTEGQTAYRLISTVKKEILPLAA